MKMWFGKSLLFVAALGWADTNAQQPAANSVDGHLLAAQKAAGLEYPGLLARLCVVPPNKENSPPPQPSLRYTAPGTRSVELVRPAGQSLRQSLLGRHDDSLLLGIENKRRDHPDRYALQLCVGTRDRRWLEEARAGPCDGEIRHRFAWTWRPRRRRQSNAAAFSFTHHHGRPDWDAIEKANNMPGGTPKRDMVATDGEKLTLGDTTVTIVLTPGHTLGTLGLLFQVKDHGKQLNVVYSGGTAFNNQFDAERFRMYIASQRKLASWPPIQARRSYCRTIPNSTTPIRREGSLPPAGLANPIHLRWGASRWRAISRPPMNARRRRCSSTSECAQVERPLRGHETHPDPSSTLHFGQAEALTTVLRGRSLMAPEPFGCCSEANVLACKVSFR